MTNEEFLNEALLSTNCPSDFEEIYSVFCKYQTMVLDALREFARICKKYNIPYQLAFGSMIGAVRDNGQIPWDYDVDVVVPYYCHDELIRALSTDLSDNFVFYTREKDLDYIPPFIRVVPKGYPHEILHLDVFYLIGIPDNEPSRSEYIREARDIYNARKYILQKIDFHSMKFNKILKCIFEKLRYSIRYGKYVPNVDEVFSRYDIRNTKEAITVSVGIGKHAYLSHVFLNSMDIETREGTFRIPCDYDIFLSNKYGDWKKYFPIDSRIAEVMKHYNQFRMYKK